MNKPKDRIIYIDDSKVARNFYELNLSPYGFDVLKAKNFEDCRELLEFSRPSCILTAYEMPDVTGPEICRSLKQDVKYQDIPIIVLTSKDSKEHLLAAINCGADDFIGKSVDVEIIVSKIRAVMRTHELLLKQVELERYRTAHAMITTYNHELNAPLSTATGMLGDSLDELNNERYLKCKEALGGIRGVVQKIEDLVSKPIIFNSYTKQTELVEIVNDRSDKTGT
ncbi:MAG: response regulator [Bdellovibrionaceae bacterium]|jgi:DNA-binding response OmpR family regulator|nr:response regulator [Pseudobdellovibrionaceae bacterium]